MIRKEEKAVRDMKKVSNSFAVSENNIIFAPSS